MRGSFEGRDHMKNFCHHCGKELDDDAYSCPECGQLTEKGMSSGGQDLRRRVTMSAQPSINPMVSIMIVALLIGVAFAGMSFMTERNGTNDPYHIEYQWSVKGQSFTCVLDISKDDYTNMMKSDIDRSGTVSSDMYVMEVNGVRKTVNGVKDYIVVDKNIETMAKELMLLCDKYNSADSGEKVGYAQFISWFVQTAVDYKTDQQSKGVSEYWRYPLETLYDKEGDCEDGAILLAALLYAAGYDSGIYLLPEHSVGAVSVDSIKKVDKDKKPTYEYQDRYQDYYPIETAYGAKSVVSNIGDMSYEYRNCYYHLYTGYSVTYYFSTPDSGTLTNL